MVRAEIKAEAKEKLRGRWGIAIGFLVVTVILEFVINLVLGFIPVIGSLAIMAISVPIAYNITISFLKFKRGENIEILDAITKIPENFVASWKVVWGVFLKLWVYVVAMVILIFAAMACLTGSLFSAFSSAANGRRYNFNSISRIRHLSFIIIHSVFYSSNFSCNKRTILCVYTTSNV